MNRFDRIEMAIASLVMLFAGFVISTVSIYLYHTTHHCGDKQILNNVYIISPEDLQLLADHKQLNDKVKHAFHDELVSV